MVAVDEQTRRLVALREEQKQRGAAKQDKNRCPGDCRCEYKRKPRPHRVAIEHLGPLRNKEARQDPDGRDRASQRLVRSPPDETQCNQTERKRKREIGNPHRDAGTDFLAAGAVHLGHHDTADGKQCGDQRGDGCRKDTGDSLADVSWPKCLRRQREQFALTCGDGGANHADDEREVVGERCAAGDPGAERASEDDFSERQERDADRREHGDDVFSLGGDAPNQRGAFACRNAARSFTAASKTSAGTRVPRWLAVILSASARNCAEAAGSSVIT